MEVTDRVATKLIKSFPNNMDKTPESNDGHIGGIATVRSTLEYLKG